MRLAPLALALLAASASGAEPFYRAELIHPPERLHNHGSCVVECPNGDLLACWFRGSGERKSDDVGIYGARLKKGAAAWSEMFVMADVPGFPDTNCCMIIDPAKRLWLLWPTILAHTWESALMKYRISADYQRAEGPPAWQWQEVLHMKPADDFQDRVRKKTEEYLADMPEGARVAAKVWTAHNDKLAGDLLQSRLGWFTRAHPTILDGKRMLVGLYSDGFSFSMTAFTDDWGKTWGFSEPIVGGGNIQPSFARKRDGTIVAYMRDNGPPPKRVMVSESKDRGETWSKVVDHATLPNPGAGLELANLADGRFIVIYNDTENGRHSLAVSISEDEGQTYKFTRHLERAEPGQGSFAYPSIIQAADGTLHATYSYSNNKAPEPERRGETIKHAAFGVDWVEAGDAAAPSAP